MESEIKNFSNLSLNELYDVLQLRTNIFVVEQDCPYPELDGKDKLAFHYLGIKDEKIIATARILPPGISYPEASIGRVAVEQTYRKASLGEKMMLEVLVFIQEKWPGNSIRISAQAHLEKFYANIGFEYTGKSYLEDGIPHIEMIKDN